MLEYQVVRAGKLATVVAKVNELIEQGWTPIGGISMCPEKFRIRPSGGDDGFDSFFSMQAMVREKP